MASKRPRDSADSDSEEAHVTNAICLAESVSPFVDLLPELWGEVASHLSIVDQLLRVALLNRALSQRAYPVKGITNLELSPIIWDRFEVAHWYRKVVMVADPPASHCPPDVCIFPLHHLTRLTGLGLTAGRRFRTVIDWLTQTQTNLRALSITMDDRVPEGDTVITLPILERLHELRVVQDVGYSYGFVHNFVLEHHTLKNLTRLELDDNKGAHFAGRDLRAIDRSMPQLQELAIHQLAILASDPVVNDPIWGFLHLTKLELLSFSPTDRDNLLFGTMAVIRAISSLRSLCVLYADPPDTYWKVFPYESHLYYVGPPTRHLQNVHYHIPAFLRITLDRGKSEDFVLTTGKNC